MCATPRSRMWSASCTAARRRKTSPSRAQPYPYAAMLAHGRLLNFPGALACAALLGFALYTQYELHLEPCPLCMFQRIGVAVLGVIFLAAALQHPRRWGVYVYAALSALAALAPLG